MYSKLIQENFNSPRNSGEIENADLIFETNNPFCGDRIKFFIKLDDKKQKIENVKFKAFGCVTTIAMCSIMTEKIKNRPISEIMNISSQGIINEVGEIPKEKTNHIIFVIDFLKDNFKKIAQK